MKRLLNSALIRRSTDILLSPVTLFSSIWYKFIRTGTASQMPVSEKIFMSVGILPIRDQYYQPLINPRKHLQKPLNAPRVLPGVQWSIEEQLALLSKFHYQEELRAIPMDQKDTQPLAYYYNNPSLCTADAEFLYSIVRHFKPRRVIEVGCGYSTRLAVQAEKKNLAEDAGQACAHICIEPYEMPWLEKLDVQVLRSKVEDVPLATFSQLEAGDILFIDSSHIIRPQGDVLFEFLEIFPMLKPGVLIHVHDIFSPRDYLQDWLVNEHRLW
ncbi:MAG TPA: class I SAM-dependent methyltransferase, partial [Puia sp.]|nr:class I SAM-dependent methyltransferase [Puia sp.]